MTIEIAKAIKTRWDAKSLGSSVTGGIHNGRPPERPTMPYCIFTDVSASNKGETACQRGTRMEIQFDVYCNDGNPETCGDLAVSVRDAFVNADRATTSPFAPTGIQVTEMRLSRNITTRAEGEEQVYRSMFAIVVMFNESANRIPA